MNEADLKNRAEKIADYLFFAENRDEALGVIFRQLRAFQRQIRQEVYAEIVTSVLAPEVIKMAHDKIVSREWGKGDDA